MKKRKDKISGGESRWPGPFKKRRGGVVLTKEEVKEIKAGRKKLRRGMKAAGIRSRKEFELTASGVGLYFDKNRRFGLLLWLFHGRALWALLGALSALLLVTFLFSTVTQMKGHFTINMGDGMFREGFSLSETEDFANPTAQLYADPVLDVPCISIVSIPEDVDEHDGQHNGKDYFAYTFYLRNEGDQPVDYAWRLAINSESRRLSSACWVMLFEDGEMTFYAQSREDGQREALPSTGDNSRGYRGAPMKQFARYPEEQYQVIRETEDFTYYRLLPIPFQSADVVVSGLRKDSAPMEVHKYTVVIWLEGDDPDCTDELIGGHLGLEMDFQLVEDQEDEWGAVFVQGQPRRDWWALFR